MHACVRVPANMCLYCFSLSFIFVYTVVGTFIVSIMFIVAVHGACVVIFIVVVTVAVAVALAVEFALVFTCAFTSVFRLIC